ncbi:MAG TPA: ATP-binding protein, partial [Pirellulales bacterium]|nr:ATP-binding protein [Pirellulales bacterium]
FGPLHCGPWPEPIRQAVVLPLMRPTQPEPAGFLIAGISPRLVFNDGYRGFLELLAGHIATATANARAYEEERRRAEALAELDRAKTAFFSNVSHEFRTPLTLMLGPIDDALRDPAAELPEAQRTRLELVRRNGLRLQRLVNTLLEFSRIEAGRARASYEPTNLAEFTAELAGVFRSACQRAGLELVVDCAQLSEPVFVDREMWEKIVLNLLSNAFKFTFEGRITVALRQVGRSVELRVQDTGTGIAEEEMPKLFERFYRVDNAQARTHEGSGIGLSLVLELVKLHGGAITADSQPRRGTTMIVTLPLGAEHLPAPLVRQAAQPAKSQAAEAYVEEALRWLPEGSDHRDDDGRLDAADAALPRWADGQRPRIIVADDNTDMRQYIVRLLATQFEVEAVADGEAALAAIRHRPAELILTDVMMPRLDGFGLLKAVRGDASIAHTPVIMLSARAGEESRVEGMQAGADGYLVKPFSARELVAMVAAHVNLGRVRREAEHALRRSEEHLRTVVDTTPACIKIVGCDGTLLDMNAAGLCMIGADTLDSVAGRSVYDVICPEHRDVYRLFNERICNGEKGTLEFDIIALNGLRRHMETHAAPIAGSDGQWQQLAISYDITERKRETMRWRTMAEALPNLLWTDLPNGQCDWLSVQWGKYTGIPEHELLGLNWLERVVHPDDRQRTLDCWNAACADTGLYDVEYRIRRYDGQYRWFKTRGVPLRDDQGRIIYWFGTCTDIEDVKQLEAALREADRRKNEFLATLAHELRNPLAPIRHGLQIMHLSQGTPELIEQTRAMMQRQLDQMVHLVDDLLDVSRVSRGIIELRKERVELARVLQHAIETSQPAIDQAAHELTVSLPQQPIFVEADTTRLAQVFANLLNNAAKYTERGGQLRLEVRHDDGHAVVTVKDNGMGIPPAMLPKVFQMFTQVNQNLNRSQGGLGIGLSIVKRLVEMHQGTIEAHSEGIGMGSDFVVRLPVLAPPAAPRRAEPASSNGSASRCRILVVDDNRDSASSLAMMLRLMGNTTQAAHDGLEALAMIPEFKPDVVLLDIGMPHLNGYETAQRIREQPWGKDLVLVALTGWGQDEDRRKSQAAGFDGHLTKPIEIATLQKLLASLLAAAK